VKFVALIIALLASQAWGAPLNPAARAVIPVDTRQVISIDYQMLRTFASAMALKAQVLPDNLKQFENALQNVGVNPDSNLDSLTFAFFDDDKQAPHMVAIASGPFSSVSMLTQLRLRKMTPFKYGRSDLYPVSETLEMTLLDEGVLLLGDTAGIKNVLDRRETHSPSIDTNKDLAEIMRPIEKATVWSVLDHTATERMFLLALGDDPKRASLASVKEKLLGAYFRMNFRSGIRFDMDIVTSDTASSLAITSLLKMGILYKKITANPAQKIALDNVSVASKRIAEDSDRSDLKMQFKADDQHFQALLHSQCFAAMTTERKEFSGFTSALVSDDPKAMDHNSENPK
jgi:hypothetical protein